MHVIKKKSVFFNIILWLARLMPLNEKEHNSSFKIKYMSFVFSFDDMVLCNLMERVKFLLFFHLERTGSTYGTKWP